MKTRLILVILTAWLIIMCLLNGILQGSQPHKISANVKSTGVGYNLPAPPKPTSTEVTGSPKAATEATLPTRTPAPSFIVVDRGWKDDLNLVVAISLEAVGDNGFFTQRDKTKVLYSTLKSLIERSPEEVKDDLAYAHDKILIGIELMSSTTINLGISRLELVRSRLK